MCQYCNHAKIDNFAVQGGHNMTLIYSLKHCSVKSSIKNGILDMIERFKG